MLLSYDKTQVKEQITKDDIFNLLNEWGGEPEYTDFGIISTTICHNKPGEGSRKLYYYEGNKLFHCYTGGCQDSSFDIFDLTIKIADIQYHKVYDLNTAIRYIANQCNISGSFVEEEEIKNIDWDCFSKYENLAELQVNSFNSNFEIYDDSILNNLNYDLILTPWLKEGISQNSINQARIGYYLTTDQITIPHYDINGNFIGLRGRSICEEDCLLYGKYRPIKIGKTIYSHPLGLNLYNLNHSKNNIQILKTAIVFESEKATLQYKSAVGIENDISVACCGSSLSAHQVNLLLQQGVQEIVVAFDRQFQSIGDMEFTKLTNKLIKIHQKYKNYANISFIFDKEMITSYKASPIDEGFDKFMYLFKNRILL